MFLDSSNKSYKKSSCTYFLGSVWQRFNLINTFTIVLHVQSQIALTQYLLIRV